MMVALFATVVSASAQSGLTIKQQQARLRESTWRVIGTANMNNPEDVNSPKLKDEYSLIYFSSVKNGSMFISLGEFDYGFGFYEITTLDNKNWGVTVKTNKHTDEMVFLVKMEKDFIMLVNHTGFTLVLKPVKAKHRIL